MTLTSEQKDVARQVVKNKDKISVQTLSGYAGTGKTTVVSVIRRALPNFAVCAYTGKAANVLRKKGVLGAATIHSMIYRPYTDDKNNTVWHLADKMDLADCEGFIVDEASMVSFEIDRDLRSFGKPIIYVGDHGQLEPIGTKFNLMQTPMYKLETVHRNAGEIAHFAEHLRKGGIPRQFNGQTSVQVVGESAVTPRHFASTDQVICAFNKTRVRINSDVRKELGIQYAYIAKGEKVMCLRNNRKAGLFNGMQGIVKKIHKDERFDIESGGEFFSRVHYDPDQIGKETNDFTYAQAKNPFDYAYAITAHKSQGDEFNNVIAYEQVCDKWDHRRWTYTVASRAKKGLVWIEAARYIPTYL